MQSLEYLFMNICVAVVILAVRLPRKHRAEGLIDKLETAEGIYMTSSVARVKGNKAITRNLNKRNEEVAMASPGVKRKKYAPDRSDRKKRTGYKGTVTPVKTNLGKFERSSVHIAV
jgi:hypothetical protein